MRFIDSNVLIYAVDPRDVVKQQRAKSIVKSARDQASYVISAQVINEFASVALGKLRKTKEDVRKFIELFKMIRTVDVRLSWSVRALEIMGRYDLQYYASHPPPCAPRRGFATILTPRPPRLSAVRHDAHFGGFLIYVNDAVRQAVS